MPTLLLADDSITVQRVIALTFAKEQIRVVAVSDGTQAVERMKTLHPDIVLAGTVLPQVSGYDLAKHMRTIPGLRNVPVLLLTGAFETVDEEKLKASGANGVLEKPVEPNNVIARVKELLGLKSDAKPAIGGRLVTPAEGPAETTPPVANLPRAVTSATGTPLKGQPGEPTGPQAVPDAAEDASARPDDYLDTLDAAFDTLDQQISGRASGEKPSRNPSGPLGQSSGAPDPRSPGRRPEGGAGEPAAGHPVFEVDEDWFGGEESQARADARAGRREMPEDLGDPALQAARPDVRPPAAVYEVDDTWFAEADKARAAKLDEQRAMAVEMGIQDVVLPHAEAVPHAPAPPSDRDFDFGLDDIKKLHAAPAPVEASDASQAPAAVLPVVDTLAPAPVTQGSASSPDVADPFRQLLESELRPPAAAGTGPVAAVQVIAPEVTAEMLEQVSARVAERLSTGGFGEQLMNAVTATVRDTVREIASATSERLVREIASEASERLGREIAAETSERVGREIAIQTSERLSREIAVETSARVSREVAVEASERLSREIAISTSDRISREIASETSERLVREIASETSLRLARDIVSETSERLVRDEIERIKSKARS